MRYLPHTESDIQEMLQKIGVKSLDELFSTVPASLRLNRALAVEPSLDERALMDHLEALASKQPKGAPFLGAGANPHHVPPSVDQLLLRGELYTAYTPYQPEIAQGTLQITFEFQTFVTLLTGLEIANASMYDGASAAAEAALMAVRISGGKRTKVVVSKALHPEYRDVVRTYHTEGFDVVEVPFGADGRTDMAALEAAIDENTAGVLVGYPNFFGVVEDLGAIAKLAQAKGAIAISCTTEALAFGLLQSPGAQGIDVAVGEMQSFGNGLNFGGPGLGFFATREKFLRQFPGRVAGATVDKTGKRGFVLTLSTREQHIRREKATSNICTNHGLNATAATIHLSMLGRHGLKALALLNYRRARYAREQLAAAGLKPLFSGPVFNEFAVRAPSDAIARITKAGLSGGLPLGRYYPELGDGLLLCVTELHDKARIDALIAALA
ncbi:aminomethyl-transferring glycine dehydrogenase subunit GcvPA [Vulgatibacter incomptus]|uniref:Probable glycine dehydrogenase (decarboxylating) subunit 1 n=1 Tax=Vulgatibacter incomptus TaxID=1391653 RepID=A0A0K1P8S0_9BACT|nr:aminomethyl-transferring glycine dehydrogenase subunit GcvPA [Vulgatibacter incomptus]AKU89806.1 Glycine dehydrogenase [decarboxylating] (glycine cleavage system P1 protein) [Vulgatibacter incomptus]